MAANVAAQGMVRDLVNQFSDTFAFYRELIQNAIDAGSNRVDVTLDYTPDPKGGPGLCVISVEDDGCGMDEGVIDGYLLVLFKSSKEDDLTKIGKFGVGFLSVFALKPHLVRLYTAKNLQSWRLDFPDYRSWHKYRMPDPRDGTRVELHKRMSPGEYAELSEKSLATVRYWCRHAEPRIYFTDRGAGRPPLQVNEPFSLPGGESLRYAEEGTEAVLGFSPAGAFMSGVTDSAGWLAEGGSPDLFDGEPFFGFYNRGLTLKEGRKTFIPGVELKIKSRYLEHTITRDNVMEDENYGKAMAIIKRLGAKELPGRLRAELEALAARLSRPEAQADAAERRALEYEWWKRHTYFRFLRESFLAGLRHDFEEWRVIPTVTGGPVTREELEKAWKKCPAPYYQNGYFTAGGACAVTRALGAAGLPVVFASRHCSFAYWLPLSPVPVADCVLAEELKPSEAGPAMAAFLKTLASVGQEYGRAYSVFYPARFTYCGEPEERRPFLFRLNPYGAAHAAEGDMLRGERLCPVLDCEHPFIAGLAGLHASRPGFAAFLLLKAMLLHQEGKYIPKTQTTNSALSRRGERRLLQAALQLDAGRAHG